MQCGVETMHVAVVNVIMHSRYGRNRCAYLNPTYYIIIDYICSKNIYLVKPRSKSYIIWVIHDSQMEKNSFCFFPISIL